MPRWDEPGSPHDAPGRRRWSGERRSFGGPGRPEPDRDAGGRDAWRNEDRRQNERFAALHDRDRIDYGPRHDDAGSAGYARQASQPLGADESFMHDGEPWSYGGQEFGVEGHGGDAGTHPGWGLEEDDEERRRNFDFDDPGIGQSQAGYAFGGRPSRDADFDPDYVRWRDARLRAHDREYEDWRRDQQRRYDAQYRRARGERPGR